MNNNITFLVVGGDLRQIYTASALSENFKVYAAGFDNNVSLPQRIISVGSSLDLPEKADYVILPLPATLNSIFVNTPFCRNNIPLTSLTSVLKDDGLVLGGKLDAATIKIFNKCGIEAIDYFDREELNVLNAVPTAEGAIQIAMEEMASTIFGQRVLITGHGRISKVLIKILNGMGAEVTVTARKYSDLAWAEIYGCHGIHTSSLKDCIRNFSLIINTVPAVILNEDILKEASAESLLIDLASKPGGVDFDTARRLGLKVVWALSLPGKVAPVSSGEIIASTILNILKERRYTDG